MAHLKEIRTQSWAILGQKQPKGNIFEAQIGAPKASNMDFLNLNLGSQSLGKLYYYHYGTLRVAS